MNDLRLADEVLKAAEYVSLHEDTDVAVLRVDGPVSIYVKGEDITPVWLASAMPQMKQGQPASYLDMTPTGVRFGRWQTEGDNFVASRSLSVEQFLELYRLSRQHGS